MKEKDYINKRVYEDEWITIHIIEKKTKTYVFNIWSKCSECPLGIIHWYPSWRAYTLEPQIEYKIELSDRCQIAIGSFTMWINAQHKMNYKNLLIQLNTQGGKSQNEK